MKNEPLKSDIAIPEAVHHCKEIVSNILISHDSFSQVLIAFFIALCLLLYKRFCEILDAFKIKDVIECSLRSFVRLPPFSQVDNIAEIERHDPSVVEMLVHDFSHSAFGSIEHVRHEEEKHKEHGALIGECE